jgi:hypothetical protein
VRACGGLRPLAANSGCFTEGIVAGGTRVFIPALFFVSKRPFRFLIDRSQMRAVSPGASFLNYNSRKKITGQSDSPVSFPAKDGLLLCGFEKCP